VTPITIRSNQSSAVEREAEEDWGPGQVAMMLSREKTKTHFAFRVDVWTANGERIAEQVAGIEGYQVRLRTMA
jgi:hypothetical protein